jgi:DNA-binding MarR family transcriptional regulator
VPRQHVPKTTDDSPRPLSKWDDAPFCREVFIVHNLMMRCAERYVADLGLTASRWLLLGVIQESEEPLTLTELSQDALLSVQNVSRMVAAVEADGLVHRFSREGHGRAVFVRLTERGRQVVELACARGERFCEHFLEHVSPDELAAAERLFARLGANLEHFHERMTSGALDPKTDAARPETAP